MTANRTLELIGLTIAPGLAAAAMLYARLGSEWQSVLLLALMLAVSSSIRGARYPLHLIPFAATALYLMVAPLVAATAIAVNAWAGYASAPTPGDMVAPVLGAWVVTGLAALIIRRFYGSSEVRVAVIGSPQFTGKLQAELRAAHISKYRIVGCIDPQGGRAPDGIDGVPCLGSLMQLRPKLVESRIDLLVLGPLDASSPDAPSRLDVFERVADVCLDLPVSLIEASQLYEELLGQVPLGATTAAWFQHLLHPSYRRGSTASKRAVDLCLGLVAALLALPLVGIAAVAIKVSDGGPILLRQRRIGEGGEEIELIKLRTFRLDAQVDGDRLPAASREHLMPVGRLLRRLHIDELPQLYLVLKGEMSLVGPRPEITEIVADLEARLSYYDRRHLLKPGITGWAQVRCGYSGSEIGSAWKLCHDLYYLKRRSLVFDLLILIETSRTLLLPAPGPLPDERFLVPVHAHKELVT